VASSANNYLLTGIKSSRNSRRFYLPRNGVSKEDMLNIINQGACGNGITNIKTPSILNDSFLPHLRLKHLVKDLRLAKRSGLDSPLIHPL
jgi:3-hydroxyisobutyrate dehydrogenase